MNMFSFPNKSVRPIGLDLGHNSVRMIQLANPGGQISVVAADESDFGAEVDCSDERRCELAAQAIKKMLGRGEFEGREVISCLSNDSLKIKSLRLDTTDADRIEDCMKQEVAERFGLDADSDEIRYMIAGNVYQGDEIKNEIIFFGMDKDSISGHLSLLEEAGLTPVAIDAVPCALFRSYQSCLRRQEDRETVSVLVDVGSLYTTVIIGRGQEVIFVKQISVAGEHLNAEVASKLGVSIDEAVVLRWKLKKDSAGSIEASTRQAIIDAMSHAI